MTRRTPRPRAYAPDPAAPGQPCDHDGCLVAGEYRAPKSRHSLNAYWWFCLEHVRAYNAAWDFYKGMSPGEIELHLRADTGWQRPTWPLGRLGGGFVDEESLADPLRVLAAGGVRGAHAAPPPLAPPELREPLATLDLGWPLTLQALKARYKALAKRHHPDTNGGDPAAEERIKRINSAYARLRARLASAPDLAAAG